MPTRSRQADRHVDCDDRGLLRRGQHIGEARHDPHARLAALRAHEGHDPSAGAAIDPGKPCVLVGSAPLSAHAGTAFATPLRCPFRRRPMTFRPRRSVLYMPGSNARAIEKARTLPADGVILDLEDAVAPEAKEQAAPAGRRRGEGRRLRRPRGVHPGQRHRHALARRRSRRRRPRRTRRHPGAEGRPGRTRWNGSASGCST